jgi:sphinganine-1-phosphate aldolase
MSDDSSNPVGGMAIDLHPYRERFPSHTALPAHGIDRAEILRQVSAMATEEKTRWDRGQVSGTYYHGGAEHYAFLNRVFSLYSHSNLLQRDLCPSGTKFEAEILAMTRRMLNGGEDVVGTVTSGGTESIFDAVLVYRELGRQRGIAVPEILAPESIHPAFEKAAFYLGVKLVRLPVSKDYRADVDSMRGHLGPHTVALAASAGNYPWGLIDPIAELSELALSREVGLHVDGCLGGFILPWIEKLGHPVPPFDFRLRGVTSMTCDTHKYGFGLKGTSTVFYRGRDLRRLQYFRTTDWQGGMYASPTMQGSRSEGLSAATWAAMVTTGEDGYLAAARSILRAAETIKLGAATIPELEILGDPTFLIALASRSLDIFHVNDFLAARGWRLNGCQNPAAIHFCVTLPQTAPGVAARFVADLREAVSYAKHPPTEHAGSGALYGLAGNPAQHFMLDELLFAFLDATYEP